MITALRWLLRTLLSLIALFGLFMVGLFLAQAWEVRQARSWHTVPCTVEYAQVIHGPRETNPPSPTPGANQAGAAPSSPAVTHPAAESSHLVVRFRYDWQGQSRTGTRFAIEDTDALPRATLEQYAAGLMRQPQTLCFVNPAAPAEAVLDRNLDQAYAMLLGGLFILSSCLVGLVYAWGGPGRLIRHPWWQRTVGRWTSHPVEWVFGIFLLAGLGFGSIFLRAAVLNIQARDWQATPCTVLESTVQEHSSSDSGDSYSVYVRYQYTFQGRTHQSDRYNFLGMSSSGESEQQAIVARYPPGTAFTCYVNPQQPADAVIDRSFSWGYLFVLLPLVFVVLGAGGWVTVRRRR